MGFMSEVTQILQRIEQGDGVVSDRLLSLVYEELRAIASAQMARERPGQTLQATALVHEAYVRLVDVPRAQDWSSRGHFFKAAAEAMRRILIERARAKSSENRGGGWQRVNLETLDVIGSITPDQLLTLDEALERLNSLDSLAAQLVQLRYIAGVDLGDAAKTLGISSATAYRHWAYARAWLHGELLGPD